MSSRHVGAGSRRPDARPTTSSNATAPPGAPPTTTTDRRNGQRARSETNAGARAAATTATFARLSFRTKAYSSTDITVLTGTAIAPSMAAPQNVAANAG